MREKYSMSSNVEIQSQCRYLTPTPQIKIEIKTTGARRMKSAFQIKLHRTCLFSLFILLSTVSPTYAGVLVIANMEEGRVVLVESETYQTLATLETAKIGRASRR